MNENVDFIQFGTLSAEEWVSFSVCEIYRPSPQGGSEKDKEGTPYDPRMGCLENGMLCGTCGDDNRKCPGHFGHIFLPIPIYNRTFFDVIVKILQCVCPTCSRPRLLPDQALMQVPKLDGLKRLRAFSKKCEKIIECPWGNDCGVLPFFDLVNKSEIRKHYGSKQDSVPFKAGESLNVLSRLGNDTLYLLGINDFLSPNPIFYDEEYLSYEKQHVHQIRAESYIFTVLPVLSPYSRPFIVRDGQNCDDDLTDKYNSILKCCIKIKEDDANVLPGSIKGKRKTGKLKESERKKIELDLQNHIWTLMYNKDEKSKLSSGGRAHKCLYQRIKGKEGHVQSNVGGKRSDFTCRTVIIGGGPMLKLDELGVPRAIASELTRRNKVKIWNREYAQDLIRKGEVNRVIRNGKTIRLDVLPDKGIKFNIQIDDVIERKLQDGDIFPFNRQPSLRKESIMAFRIKIIDGYAFRLSLCFTPAFNADFDGDEMNGHVPQSISATAEAEVLMRAAVHIVTGQKNAPINGIVQDGLVGSFLMTNTWEDGKITMIDVDTYLGCLEGMGIDHSRLEDFLLRAKEYYPEYIKIKDEKANFCTEEIPGKLAFGILFPPNFCYDKKTDTNPNFPKIKIEDGVLHPSSGPICKKIIGAKPNSVVHVLWKDYSPEVALSFLSDNQQLIDRWLPTHGFSMGISDCFASSKDEVAKVLTEMHAKINTILNKCDRNPDDRTEVEINGILNSAMNVGLSLAKNNMAKGDRNSLNIMRNSGAKGNLVNLVQIVAFVGQQNIAGQRIPMSISGCTRTLPHFDKGDHSAEARGFVEHGYLVGLTPQEVFFHAEGGRVGIISTAIKSVVWETPLVIIENEKSKRVLIGEWIDDLMERNLENVEKYPDDNNLQVLKVENTFIPTLDKKGNTSWGELTAVTRHDPSKILYKIKTQSGREVTVAESKSLLVWDEKEKEFLPKHSAETKIGDYVPVSFELPEPPIIKKYIDMDDYFPRTEYIYGTDMICAYRMLEEQNFKPKAGWWGKHNGIEFTLPYKYPWQLLRNFKSKDQKSLQTIEDYKEGYVYPLSGKRNDTYFPERLELDYENGFFIGLYIADGDSNVKDGHIRISKNDEVIQEKVKAWFNRYNIKHETYRRENEFGYCDSMRGFSVMWARFFIETCGHKAQNKKVPSETFIADGDFVAGLLNGYISGDGWVAESGKSISMSSSSERLRDEISILLLRFGIFSRMTKRKHTKNNLGTQNISDSYILDIRNVWANEYAELIGCDHSKKKERLENREIISPNIRQKYQIQRKCIKDKIISIEELNPSHPFLYDVTVPKTLNFILGNCLGIADTAETGYISKRIGRKVEDYKIGIDGTVRDSNCKVIQFLYGDDGMDPKKLCYSRGIDFPFFINPVNIALRLNSDAKRQKQISPNIIKRILNKEELELTLSYIHAGPPHLKNNIIKTATENCKTILRKLLKNPKTAVYEFLIPSFCSEIKNMYESSKAQYGDMPGLDAGGFIGEPTTQMSSTYSTRVVIREVDGKSRKLTEVKCGKIGEIIDKLLEKNSENVVDIGGNSVIWKPPHPIYIMTVNTENEKTEWKEVSEVSRHPTNGNLVRVKTKSKREIVTTLSHSHLSRTKEGKIIPVIAKNLKKGDFIPVNKKMNSDILYKSFSAEKFEIEFDFDNGKIFGSYLSEKHKIDFVSHIQKFVLEYCSTCSSDKQIPGFALFAPLEFVSGLLRGYFDGNGNISAERQFIKVHSINLNLLEQISLLFSRLGIFGTFEVENKDSKNPLYGYVILRKYSRVFLEKIGSDFPEKMEALQKIVDYNEGEDVHSRREDIDKIPMMEEEIAKVEKFLGLSGYSRNYGKCRKAISRETLSNYVRIFQKRSEELGKDIDLSLIHQAINSDVIWDEIEELEIIEDPKEMVYDFSVKGNHTFMIQNGIFVHNTLDTFHLAGVKEKDVSLGVPRFNELLNATKSDKQKKSSCTGNFDIPLLNKNTKKICDLEKQNKNLGPEDKDFENRECISNQLKEINLSSLQSMKNDFEETTVGTFFVNYEMQYIPGDVDPKTGMSPINIIKYKEYEKRWWVTLREKLYRPPKFEARSWVLIIKLNTEEMFLRDIDLEDIAEAINSDEKSEDKYCCIPSPNVFGLIEVYCNFSEIKEHIKTKIELPPGDVPERDSLFTMKNIEFFTCRDVALNYIKNIKISGITGTSKVYYREDPMTHKWIMDIECKKVPCRISKQRFLNILTADGIDPYLTTSDDVHAIYSVLGIEAARRFLIEEKTRVISFDGTYINPRHIQLLVDGMTHTGEITSVRRDGIPRDVGPIAKIMFEQAVDNAIQAAAFGEVDMMKTVSSSIMYGKTVKSGTGVVEVRSSDKMPSYPVKIDIKKDKEEDLDEEVEIELFNPKTKKETPKEKSERKKKMVGSKRKNIIIKGNIKSES